MRRYMVWFIDTKPSIDIQILLLDKLGLEPTNWIHVCHASGNTPEEAMQRANHDFIKCNAHQYKSFDAIELPISNISK